MQRPLSAIPWQLPSLERLRSADLLLPLVLSLSFALPLLLALAGVGIRHDLNHPLVINEIAVTPKDPSAGAWVELYNTTDAPISINGWKISTASRDVQTLDGTVEPHDFRLIKLPGVWNAQSDAVILRGVDNDKLDAVNWGTAPDANPLPDWNATRLQAPPAQDKSVVRNPQGFDSDSGKDWLTTKPTPNAPSPASLNTGLYRVLFDVTNYVSLIAGFLLWGSFLLIGLIAKRFEMLTGQRSFWLAMSIAPIGIIVYNAIQSYAFFTAGKMTECKAGLGFANCQQGWAFVPLFISAVAMVYVVYRFYGIARRILEV